MHKLAVLFIRNGYFHRIYVNLLIIFILVKSERIIRQRSRSRERDEPRSSRSSREGKRESDLRRRKSRSRSRDRISRHDREKIKR